MISCGALHAPRNASGEQARGMSQFRPYVNRPQVSMTYYEVPADILEEPDACVVWARRSAAVAAVVKKVGTRRKKSR